MTTEKLYHICNLGQMIVFRNEEDYLMAINRLAACAYATQSEVWAYSVMSTHFHIVLRTENIKEFVWLYQRHISTWHRTHYKTSIHLDINYYEVNNTLNIKNLLNYVLQNSVHHKVVDICFSYPYSSTHCYFSTYIERGEFFTGEKSDNILLSPKELSYRDYSQLFGKVAVPDTYKILDSRMVLPSSFVKKSRVEGLYETPRNFIYNMIATLKEEKGLENEGREKFISLYGKISDIELCSFIDKNIAPKTYSEISESEIEFLWDKLWRLGVSKVQFERAIKFR